MPSQEFLDYQTAVAQAAAANSPPEFATEQQRRASINQLFGGRPLADGATTQPVAAGAVAAIWAEPAELAGSADAPVICYFHGGGYRVGSAKAWAPFGTHLAAACQARVLLVDYALAPEQPFPAAVNDALAAYRWLLETTDPSQIVLAGDSAGGGLAPALLMALREAGLALPAGCVCLSPWSDLTNAAASFQTNQGSDFMFSKEAADAAAESYLAGHAADHPHASPVFGDWQGMPPLLIQAGSPEVLLDDARNLAAAAQQAGVAVELKVFDDMPHVWQLNYPAFPEAVEAVDDIARFVQQVAR